MKRSTIPSRTLPVKKSLYRLQSGTVWLLRLYHPPTNLDHPSLISSIPTKLEVDDADGYTMRPLQAPLFRRQARRGQAVLAEMAPTASRREDFFGISTSAHESALRVYKVDLV